MAHTKGVKQHDERLEIVLLVKGPAPPKAPEPKAAKSIRPSPNTPGNPTKPIHSHLHFIPGSLELRGMMARHTQSAIPQSKPRALGLDPKSGILAYPFLQTQAKQGRKGQGSKRGAHTSDPTHSDGNYGPLSMNYGLICGLQFWAIWLSGLGLGDSGT